MLLLLNYFILLILIVCHHHLRSFSNLLYSIHLVQSLHRVVMLLGPTLVFNNEMNEKRMIEMQWFVLKRNDEEVSISRGRSGGANE